MLAAVVLGNGNEPFIAVDPFNPLNVVVGGNGLGAVFSTDGAETFSGASVPAGYGGDPGLAIDSDGDIFFSYLINDSVDPMNLLDIAVSNTTFASQNFAANQIVISNGNQSDDKELIAADHFTTSPFRDNIYVAWRELSPEGVRYSMSTDGGTTFGASQVLTTPANVFTSGADPEVGPSGEVYIAYWDGSNIGGDVGEVRLLKSTDGGVTFFNPVSGGGGISAAPGVVGFDATGLDHNGALMRNQPPNQSFRWDVRTMIDIEADPLRSGNVYAIWLTDPDGTTAGDAANVMFSRSVDAGVNWSTPAVLNDDGGSLTQHMPTIAVDEAGNLVAVWYDERLSPNVSDPNLSIFGSVSLDGGVTWSPNFLLENSTFDPDSGGANTFIGDYIKVAAADGTAYAAWTQTSTGGTDQILVEKFSILAAYADRFEPNNSQANATVLGSLSEITLQDLTIHDEDDEDWFKITANSTGSLIINALFDHEIGNIDISVWDEDGDLIDSSASMTDNEQIIMPVVTQESYFLRVVGFGDDKNHYDLEIENFATEPPIFVALDPASDTGMFGNDNFTNDATSTIFVIADLSTYPGMGISVLDAADVAAGADGAAVEVFVSGTSVGFADLVVNTDSTVFEYTFTPGQLGEGLNFITSAVRVFDGAMPSNTGRTRLSSPLLLTLDTTSPFAGATLPDMLASSDSGMFDNDDVTNKMSPAFEGIAEARAKVRVYANGLLVGQGVVGSDSSDGVIGDGLGKWEVTVEPLVDNKYTITAEIEDMAGNVVNTTEIEEEFELDPLMIWIDTINPNTAFLDLLTDSGRNSHDNVTNVNQPTVSATVDDTVNGNGNPFPNDIKFRIYDRPDLVGNNGEVLVYDSFVDLGGLTTGGFFGNIVLDESYPGLAAYTLIDGQHNLKLEVEDRAGNLSDDFLLDLVIDTIAPPVPALMIDPASSDTGVPGQPQFLTDHITSDTDTRFIGIAEADALVRLYADGPAISEFVIDGSDVFDGETVAVPLDGNQAESQGQYELTTLKDLNNPIYFSTDGRRQMGATAEDVAGNVSDAEFLDIFIDTRGPQVDDVSVTNYNDYPLFDPKPSEDGPTPLVYGLDIDFVDAPVRVLLSDGEVGEVGVSNDLPVGSFVYPAVNELLATTPGNYRLVGDHTGHVLITQIGFEDHTVPGDLGYTRVTLYFAEPLPDDRYTLTVFDTISDDVGNALDGESQAASPFDEPGPDIFPSGDLVPGSDFVARFTVDTRPEIGTYAYEAAHVDTNGNFVFDPEGEDNDQTNRDLVYHFGFTTDVRFAGNFANGRSADGFDKLAAYGFVGGQWRWLVDTDNDGVPNIDQVNPLAIQGFPVAGDFNSLHPGDEVGLFTGDTWYFDVDGNFLINNVDIAGGIPGQLVPGRIAGGNMVGYPIVGDFDGDGLDDLGTWDANRFMFDLASNGLNGFIDPGQVINFGFPGVVERPVAADMDGDGIDDVGLWSPEQASQTPGEASEWYFLLSDDFGVYQHEDDGQELAANNVAVGQERVIGTVNTLNHPFSPAPLGQDLFAQFGDVQAIPIVGNFDPPVAGASSNNDGGQTTIFDAAANTAFLEEIYRDILGRGSDASGMSSWLVAMEGGMSRDDVAHRFWYSTEHMGILVDGYYDTYLDRAADAGGREYWTQQMVDGMSQSVLAVAFLASDEYIARNASYSAYVDSLYQRVLGRESERAGHDYWVGQLESGLSRPDAVQVFVHSTEKQTRVIDSYYDTLLDRSVDADELAVYLALIKDSGSTLNDVVESILASEEYFAKAYGA